MSIAIERGNLNLAFLLACLVSVVAGAGIVRVMSIETSLAAAVIAFFLTFGATLVDRDLGLALFGLGLGGLFTDAPLPETGGVSFASGGGLALALIARSDRPRPLYGPRSLLLWIPLAIMAVAVVSWLANGSPSTSVGQWMLPMIRRISIVLVLLLFCETARCRRLVVVIALLVPTVVQAIFGGMEWIGYQPQIYSAWIGDTEHTRVGGLAGEPNYFALSLVMGIAFAFAFLRHRLNMLLSIVALSLATVVFGFTLSRGGLLALAAVGIATVLSPGATRKRRPWWTLLGLGLVLGILLISAPSALFDRFEEVSGSSDPQVGGSAAEHLALARGAIALAIDSPLVGVGPDQTRYEIGAAAPYDVGVHSAHITFLDMAADLGIPGFLLWAAFMYLGVKLVLRSLRVTTGTDHAIAYGCWLALVAFLVGSLFLTTQLSNGIWMTLGLIGSFPDPDLQPDRDPSDAGSTGA